MTTVCRVECPPGADIFVRFTEEGFHRWPQAPDHRAYLRVEHRHLFHVEVQTSVRHDEREIEFHDLMEKSRDLFRALQMAVSDRTQSCETMARAIAQELASEYRRMVAVSISEDGECGAIVTAWVEADDDIIA